MGLTRFEVGDTIKLTWINSGSSPSLVAAVLTTSDTIVSSGAPTASGNGHFYYHFTPTSAGYYVAAWSGTVNGRQTHRRMRFVARVGGVS